MPPTTIFVLQASIKEKELLKPRNQCCKNKASWFFRA
ncbi:hypothetical protein AAZX31_18G101800 [Glycine max]